LETKSGPTISPSVASLEVTLGAVPRITVKLCWGGAKLGIRLTFFKGFWNRPGNLKMAKTKLPKIKIRPKNRPGRFLMQFLGFLMAFGLEKLQSFAQEDF
jgi:hypothetical protein